MLLLTFRPNGTIGRPLDAWDIALTNNLAGIVLARLFVSAPFVVVSAYADSRRRFETGDGGGDPRRFALGYFPAISLPLAWPGIAAGITLAWIRALENSGPH